MKSKISNLRLLHYPEVQKSVLDQKNQTRAGAHTDYGTLTLLFQDSAGGLEVKNSEGHFVSATLIKGTIVINAGDILQRWSNDYIKSTLHQVVSPKSGGNDGVYPARYSIAYFCNPNQDTTISCLKNTGEPKYEAVNAYEYLTARLAATYTY